MTDFDIDKRQPEVIKMIAQDTGAHTSLVATLPGL